MVFNSTFNNTSSYIVAVSFTNGGNQTIWRKPDLPQKLYHIINQYCVEYTSPLAAFELTILLDMY